MKALIFIVVFLLALAVSWAVTVGIVFLICHLTGWTFSLAYSIAIAFWQALCLVRGAIAQSRKD